MHTALQPSQPTTVNTLGEAIKALARLSQPERAERVPDIARLAMELDDKDETGLLFVFLGLTLVDELFDHGRMGTTAATRPDSRPLPKLAG